MALANPILSQLPASTLKPSQVGSWRRLRDLILPVLQMRVARAVRRGETVVIGSAEQPYESLADRHRLLALLPDDRSLVVRLRCAGRAVLDDLPRLIEIDRTHDLSVEWMIDRPRRLGWARHETIAAGRLAAEGIRVRLVWRAVEPWQTSELNDVESWVAEARRQQIWDLGCQSNSAELQHYFEILRLEYGFPIQSPGRG